MLTDILYWTLRGLGLFVFVLVMMTPFFGYLYWLNTKQNRYFKKLASELKLEYKTMGNKIKRDFPELNGFIDGVQCFVGARRSKGRYGFNAATRNHYPIIAIQVAIKIPLDKFALKATKKEITAAASPDIRLKTSTLQDCREYAENQQDFLLEQVRPGVLQVTILNELSNQKQYDKVAQLVPVLVKIATDINNNA